MNIQSVSVVVPTHFRDAMLAECLASLMAQTLQLYEVVVVDDGGSGSARKVVERFAPRCRYLWQPNGGQPSARNRGARAATGEWIAFLDDDDLWLPERHARVAELIATGQVDLIAGDFTKFGDDWVAPKGVFDEIEQQLPGFWDNIPREPNAPTSIVGKFPTPRLLPMSPFWGATLVIRRDLFDRLNGWNENLRGIKSEDNEFTFRAIKNGQLGIIWSRTMQYRTHPGNDSNSSLLNKLGRIHIWETILLSENVTADEKIALSDAINTARHEVLWSAFKEKEYAHVINTARRINRTKLTEKIKIFVSKFLYMKP